MRSPSSSAYAEARMILPRGPPWQAIGGETSTTSSLAWIREMLTCLVVSSQPKEKPQTLARFSKERDEVEGQGMGHCKVPLVVAFIAMAFVGIY